MPEKPYCVGLGAEGRSLAERSGVGGTIWAIAEAGKLLRGSGRLWRDSSVARRNGMAKAILYAATINPEERIVVRLPKEAVHAPIPALAEGEGVAAVAATKGSLTGNGGDGGGRDLEYPNFPILVRFMDLSGSQSSTGYWVRQMRIKSGMTKKELAELVGVHEKTVHSWEDGKTTPRRSKLRALSQIMGEDSRLK